MLQRFTNLNKLLAVGFACTALMLFSSVTFSQTSPLSVEVTPVDASIDGVPLGTDATFAIKVTNTSIFEAIDNINLTLSSTDASPLTVELTQITIGTLGAGESFETEYTIEQIISGFALNATAMGSLITDNGSAGTMILPTSGSDEIVIIVSPPEPIDIGGVGTPGYWKNHHEVWAHLPTILIGDYNQNWICDADESCLELSNEDALFVLDAKNYNEGKDKRYTLYRSLTAAWLNIIAGNEDSCIEDTVNDAIAWLQEYGNPVEDARDGVKGNAVKGKYWSSNGNELYKALDIYNNIGSGCAIDRDSGDIAAATGGYSAEMYARYKFGQLPIAYLPILSQ